MGFDQGKHAADPKEIRRREEVQVQHVALERLCVLQQQPKVPGLLRPNRARRAGRKPIWSCSRSVETSWLTPRPSPPPKTSPAYSFPLLSAHRRATPADSSTGSDAPPWRSPRLLASAAGVGDTIFSPARLADSPAKEYQFGSCFPVGSCFPDLPSLGGPVKVMTGLVRDAPDNPDR